MRAGPWVRVLCMASYSPRRSAQQSPCFSTVRGYCKSVWLLNGCLCEAKSDSRQCGGVVKWRCGGVAFKGARGPLASGMVPFS